MSRAAACAAALVLLAALAARCGGDEPFRTISGGIEPTLASIQAEVFTPSCALAGCHAPPEPQLGQDLSEGAAHASIVEVPSVERPDLLRVAPGDAPASYLFKKITAAPDILGDRMPLGGAPLSDEAIEAIRVWIESGAPAD